MKLKKPVPSTIRYRGKRYYWVNNYAYKTQAQKKASALKKQGFEAVVVSLDGDGSSKYAVYERWA